MSLPSIIAGIGPLGTPELLILLVLAASIVAPVVVIVGVFLISRRKPKPPPLSLKPETQEYVRDEGV